MDEDLFGVDGDLEPDFTEFSYMEIDITGTSEETLEVDDGLITSKR